MSFFAGLPIDEAAAALGISASTAKPHWPSSCVAVRRDSRGRNHGLKSGAFVNSLGSGTRTSTDLGANRD
jgi:hypothetical protein